MARVAEEILSHGSSKKPSDEAHPGTITNGRNGSGPVLAGKMVKGIALPAMKAVAGTQVSVHFQTFENRLPNEGRLCSEDHTCQKAVLSKRASNGEVAWLCKVNPALQSSVKVAGSRRRAETVATLMGSCLSRDRAGAGSREYRFRC